MCPGAGFRKLSGAMDDPRCGMSLNRHMKVFISHGCYVLVTPSFSSGRLVQLMKLTPQQKENLTTEDTLVVTLLSANPGSGLVHEQQL